MKLCSFPGCAHPLLARGYCKRHYDRLRRHGDPSVALKPMSDRGKPRHWIEQHRNHADDGCLIWPFARLPDGRAHLRGAKPSRVMCELAYGPAPSPEHQAAHSCGKAHEGCVHPRHLRWATPSENAADKITHGTVVRGEEHYGSKLTAESVREIRSLRGKMLQRDIAKRFGVRITCINKVLNRKTWGHVA